jgi:hypothetical protein
MSERRFFVLCRETCPTCKGSGLVPNPLWNERILEADETIDPDHWAHAAGLTLARHMGPEEIPCTDCEGDRPVNFSHAKVPAPLQVRGCRLPNALAARPRRGTYGAIQRYRRQPGDRSRADLA